MDRLKRRALLYLASLVIAVTAFTLAYQTGMRVFEGTHRSLAESLQVVIQTYTTVGYGQDAPLWTSLEMNILMVMMQVTGVFHLFVTLPLFVIPWVQEAMQRGAPASIPDLDDHIIVCESATLGETLLEQLDSREMPYVLVEPDRQRADDYHAEGYRTICGDPEDLEVLQAAAIPKARHVVVDAPDEKSPSIVLAVREARPDVPVSCIVREAEHVPYLRYAGATAVLSPRMLLGRSLALKASTAVTEELGDAVELGRDLRVAELPVMPESALCDRPLSESRIRERTGASVLGVWLKGDFIPSPPPTTVLDERSVLLVAGKEAQLEALKQLTHSEARQHHRGSVVIAGFGEVGQAANSVLDDRGMRTVIIHDLEAEAVDVVGDATDEDVLREAGVSEAGAVVIALPDDTKAIFSILVAREVNPNVEIIARANDADNIPKMYRAGADYVLGLSSVSGRMLARSIFGEDVMSPARTIKIIRADAESLAGQSFKDADVGSRTGCTVVAIERNGEVLTDLGPDFIVLWDDKVIVAGTDEDVQRFNALFGG